MANIIVEGDMYRELDGQLHEIKSQLRQPSGYPFDPDLLRANLQHIIEGRFPYRPPQQGIHVPMLVPQGFKAKETNLAKAILAAEQFTKKVLGERVDLRKRFDFPAEPPWKDVLCVYDPGFNNRQAVEKALQGQKLTVFEETDLMEYSGCQALSHPTLHIIENSLRPTEDTLGNSAKSPDQLNADGRIYLDQRGYALAFGQRYFTSKDYLDPETWTWFPKNRLPSGSVGRGCWDPDDREVRFDWWGSVDVYPRCGARLAIPVTLKP